MFSPSVSIVINTYNRATSLENTLAGLTHLDYPNYEIVVVNGPSKDTTSVVLERWADRIKMAQCDIANLSVSRNIGINAASGDIVAFIDDDAVPHPQWMKRLASSYADEIVGGVGGFTVDNTGVEFQCRKTLCDRFGNAYHVSPMFDERALCRPGSPIYPSLLGTNSSFRRSVLREIGGFDHTFAYLLDETDVCLRIIDAGYRILHEASALVFHQFSASHIRSPQRVARTVYPSAISKAYFIMHHGARQSVEDAGKQLTKYREEILKSNEWLAQNGVVTGDHRVSLDQDLMVGINEGLEKSQTAGAKIKGDLAVVADTPFKPFSAPERKRVALISQGFPPSGQAGVARWTWMMATGLAARGHAVHVICRAEEAPFTRFDEGYWVHAVKDDSILGEILATKHKVPPHVAARAAAVRSTVQFIKSFGLDVLSFPIWDIEGIGCLDDPTIGIIMSLHTSYSLAKPYKKEWNLRPLYEHFAVNPVIAAEGRLLGRVPTILANSDAIVADLGEVSGVDFSARTIVAPHGTTDPFVTKPQRRELRAGKNGKVKLLYVGRFEARKGFDIAATAFANVLLAALDVEIDIVGDTVVPETEAWLTSIGVTHLLDNGRVKMHGMVERERLDDLYAEADVVLMPSRYESFGLVAIEAMAAGAPVIALDSGGLAEVVEDGVSGRLISMDGREAQSVTEALTALIRDAGLRDRLGKGARKAFEERFTIDRMIDGVELALEQAIQRKEIEYGN